MDLGDLKHLPFNFSKFVKENPTPRICVLGTTGSGKTVFCRQLCSMYQMAQHQRILTVDLKREFDDIPEFQKSDLQRLRTFNRKILAFSMKGQIIKNPTALLEFASIVAIEFAPMMVYCEEVVEAVGKNDYLPVSHPNLYEVVQQGRSKGAGFIASTQMLAQLNLALIRQATAIFIFQCRENELRYIEDIIGLKKDRLAFMGGKDDLYSFFYIGGIGEEIHQFNRIGATFNETRTFYRLLAKQSKDVWKKLPA